MPRVGRGPYLKLRKREGARRSGISRWGRWTATGVSAEDADGARQAFSDYLSNDVTPPTSSSKPLEAASSQMWDPICYRSCPKAAPTRRSGIRLTRIVEFFGDMACDESPFDNDAFVRWRTHSGNPEKANRLAS